VNFVASANKVVLMHKDMAVSASVGEGARLREKLGSEQEASAETILLSGSDTGLKRIGR